MEKEREKQKRWLELVRETNDKNALLAVQLQELDSRISPEIPPTECNKYKTCESCIPLPKEMLIRPPMFICDDGAYLEDLPKMSVSLNIDYEKYPILLKYRMEDSLARAKLGLEKQQQETLERLERAFKHKTKKKTMAITKVIEIKCITEPCSKELPEVLRKPRLTTKNGKLKDNNYFTKRAIKASRCMSNPFTPCCKITYSYDPSIHCPKEDVFIPPLAEQLKERKEPCNKDIYPQCMKLREEDICKLKIVHPGRFCSDFRLKDYELLPRRPSVVNPVRVPVLRLARPCMHTLEFKDQQKIDALRRFEEVEKKTLREFDHVRHEMMTEAVCPRFAPPPEEKEKEIFRIDTKQERPACVTRKFAYDDGDTDKCYSFNEKKKPKKRSAEGLKHDAFQEFLQEFCKESSPKPKTCFCDPDYPAVYVKEPKEEIKKSYCPSKLFPEKIDRHYPPPSSTRTGWRCKEDVFEVPNPVPCSNEGPMKIPVIVASQYCDALGPYDSVLEGLTKAKPKKKGFFIEDEVIKEPTPVHRRYDRDGCPLQLNLCPKPKKKCVKRGWKPNNMASKPANPK